MMPDNSSLQAGADISVQRGSASSVNVIPTSSVSNTRILGGNDDDDASNPSRHDDVVISRWVRVHRRTVRDRLCSYPCVDKVFSKRVWSRSEKHRDTLRRE